MIATSESGLDMRYASEEGRFGPGIYFANNAKYPIVNNFASKTANG